jgi:hypothetical protein
MTTTRNSLLIPLPSPPPLDLSTPSSLVYWQALPPDPKRSQVERVEFWRRMPPLTAPQFAALRMQRPVTWVSLETIRSTSEWLEAARFDNRHIYEWHTLQSYPRLWGRSHTDVVVRFNPRKVRKQGATTACLQPLMSWVTPDACLERRFLMSGFPAYVSYRDRREAVRKALQCGVTRGYIEIVGTITVPMRAYRPTVAWCKVVGILERRWKESALEHGQMAVEAALATLASNGEYSDAIAFETEAASLAASRGSRRVRAGDKLGAVPDLVTIDGDGRRRATEIISENYRDDDIATKYDGLAHHVDFVGTSPSVASRVAAATGAPCLHF